jgi:hypothetical protein
MAQYDDRRSAIPASIFNSFLSQPIEAQKQMYLDLKLHSLYDIHKHEPK